MRLRPEQSGSGPAQSKQSAIETSLHAAKYPEGSLENMARGQTEIHAQQESKQDKLNVLTWLVPKATHLTCPQTAKKLRVPGQLAAANVPSVPVLLTHNKHRDNTARQKGDSDVSRPSQD
ncbi:hypothetical protein JOQ06_006426 [Pogonophryne albipinna]|uniref:Uncharacterized protein n=1 Tax=Pogonophryne albipinna TaxID=1090488 RepID=A0AAD6BHE8_9TELE|nr:hypothetical protein JOQ06_006426 [Pogonophryne albipinna]